MRTILLLVTIAQMAIGSSIAQFIRPAKSLSPIEIKLLIYDYRSDDFKKSGVTLGSFRMDDTVWKLRWHSVPETQDVPPPGKSLPAADIALNLSKIERYLQEIGMPEQFILEKEFFLGAIKHVDGDGKVLWFYQFYLMDNGFGYNSQPIYVTIPITEGGLIPVQLIKLKEGQ